MAVLGPAESTGTRVTLHPDPLIFRSTDFEARRLLDTLRPLAFLHPGLRIDFADERSAGVRETLHGRGIATWVALLGESQDGFPAEPLRLRAARLDVTVDVALRWTRGGRSYVRVFANDHEVCAEALAHGIAKGVKRAARRAGMAWALRGWDPQRLTGGLAAIADLRSPRLEIICGCRTEPGNLGARVLREAVAVRLAEALKRQPGLLEELTKLAMG
jgi:DNA gyrase subunit B